MKSDDNIILTTDAGAVVDTGLRIASPSSLFIKLTVYCPRGDSHGQPVYLRKTCVDSVWGGIDQGLPYSDVISSDAPIVTCQETPEEIMAMLGEGDEIRHRGSNDLPNEQ